MMKPITLYSTNNTSDITITNSGAFKIAVYGLGHTGDGKQLQFHND